MLLTPKDAAVILGVSTWTVLQKMKTGELPGMKVGPRSFRIDAAELDAYRRRITIVPKPA